jgi:3-oxoacyl-[acyl-carrier-protein] synthase II
VTGIGAINSLGLDLQSSFEAIINSKCGIERISAFDVSAHSVQIAGEVKGFDPKDVMDAKEVKKADRFIHLGLKAAQESIADSGIFDSNAYERERVGTSAGSGIGGLINIEKNAVIQHERGPKKISPFFIPSSLANMLGGFVSIQHTLRGPNLASVTACAAGTHAISEACKTIILDGADAMVVVASEDAICHIGMGGFASMRALSTRNDDPQKASRPFDRDRDGFVMGEGAGSLVIEEYESAKKRGAKIYGEIIGFGESGDANHITSPVVDGPLRAMRAALKMATKNSPDLKIDYINAHGTSTPANDKNETLAIKTIFTDGYIPPTSSIKGQIGHCLGAAGAIEAAMTLEAMRRGIFLPTINQENSDEDCDLDYIPNTARDGNIDIAMSNSFGFGGTNGVLIFKKI